MVLNLGADSINAIVDDELNKAEMLGYDVDDINPELMGGLIANIAARIRAAREKRKSGAEPSSGLTVSTGSGTMSINDQGFSLLKPQTGGGMIQSGGLLDQVKENPLLIAVPAALLAIILMRR